MPVLTWDELTTVVADKIDGDTSLVLWDEDDAQDWALANEYDTWDAAISDGLERPRWRFVIVPSSALKPSDGWKIIDEHWGYPDSDSGYSHRDPRPGFEAVYYPTPGESVSASDLIDEALMPGMPMYGEAPDIEAYE